MMFTSGSLIGASASSPLSNEGQSSETQNSNVTITTRTSNPVYNSESRSEHPTQISAPRPDITIKTEPDPDEVTYGESFNITVEVTNQKRRENISEPAGPPSLISISFPQLDESDDKSQLSIVNHSFNNTARKTILVKAGRPVMHQDGKLRTLEYAVAEVGMIEGKWNEGEKHSVTVNVKPKELGEFKINVRTRLWSHSSSPPKRSRSYPQGLHRGQQLYPVTHEYVKVVPATGCKILGWEIPVLRKPLCDVFTSRKIAAGITISGLLLGAAVGFFNMIVWIGNRTIQRRRE
jgi:hypothetical protein